LWSVANETPVKPDRLTFLTKLVQDAKEFDSTRLTTSAMNHVDETAPDVRTLSDPLGEVVDVLGLNEYLGWYWGHPEDADKMQWKSTWTQPLIVSEFGGEAPYARHGDSDALWTEEYQDNLYKHQLGMIERMPNLTDSVGADGFSVSSACRVWVYHNRGRIESRGAEAGVLHAAEVL
jgi:beta-glucuronidase